MDYALKPVISALGGTHILSGVFAVDQWITRLELGGYDLTERLRERLDDALNECNQNWPDIRLCRRAAGAGGLTLSFQGKLCAILRFSDRDPNPWIVVLRAIFTEG